MIHHTFGFGPPSYGGSFKIVFCQSVRLSVCLSIRQFCIFLRNDSLVFSNFWHNGRWFVYLKTDRALFSRKIDFGSDLGKKGLKWSQNSFFLFFWKILLLVFLGNNKMGTSIVVDISSPIQYLAEFWFLSYGPKFCQPMKL